MAPCLDQNGSRAGHPPESPTTGLSGGFLNVSDLVMGLREHYPHPSNAGAPRRVPAPAAIEIWIGEAIQLGRLEPATYPAVLDAAKAAARDAETRPDDFRRGLKTWIRESAWGETVEDVAGLEVVIPPPSKGPRFTPKNWLKPNLSKTTKDQHGKLDDGGGS